MQRWVRCLGYIIILGCVCLSGGCAHLTAQRMSPGQLAPTDTLYVWFEFDRIPLAPIILAACRDQGLPVAASQEEASVLLTGAYAADYDLIHWRFRRSQFKLIRFHTRQTLLLLETGAGGLQSVEAVVRKMTAEIKQLGPNPTSLLPGAISLAETVLRPFW